MAVHELTKSFGRNRANDKVSLWVTRGSVHAILGENGAGKTTLVSQLYGLLQPDSGRIVLNGEAIRIASPRDALDRGIGMVHQHFMLVGPLTVTENVVLGLRGGGARLSLAAHGRKIRSVAEALGFDVDPALTVDRLPVGMQQRVEILKCNYRDAKLLILDELGLTRIGGHPERFRERCHHAEDPSSVFP